MTALVISFLMASNVLVCSGPHINDTFFLVSSLKLSQCFAGLVVYFFK